MESEDGEVEMGVRVEVDEVDEEVEAKERDLVVVNKRLARTASAVS